MDEKEVRTESLPRSGGAYVLIIALIAASGSFIIGYDIVIMSGAILFLEKEFDLNDFWYGFAMTSAGIGAFLGLIVGGFVTDRIGRKRTLMLIAILFGISAVGTALPRTFFEWNLYRILGGVGVGLSMIVCPMYIAEIAPARKRGMLVMMYQIAQVVGAFLSNVAAWGIAGIENIAHWRWMFATECIAIGPFLIALTFIPESPRWLIQRNRTKEARDILTRVDGPEHAERELEEISDSIAQESGTFSELFEPGIRVALLVAVVLGVSQSLSGVSTVIFYAPTIFMEAGIALETEALKQTIILVVWNIACTVCALLIVDRLGRRPMLLCGSFGMALGQLFMGISFQLDLSPYYLMASMFLAIGSFIFSLASIFWVMLSEIFPNRIRARGMMVTVFIMSIAGMGLNLMFKTMLSYFEGAFGSKAGPFWIFAVVCLAAHAFIYFKVPETKGKSLEEIERFWRSQENA